MESPSSTQTAQSAGTGSRSISPLLKNATLILAGCFLMLVLVLLYTSTGSLKTGVASWLGFNKEEVVTKSDLLEVMKPFVTQIKTMETELGPGGLVAWKQSRDREFKLAVEGMASAITSPATVEAIKKDVTDLQGLLKKEQEENAALKAELASSRNDIKAIVSYIETNLYPALQAVQQQSAATKTAVDGLTAAGIHRQAYQPQPETSYVPTGVVIATPAVQTSPVTAQTQVPPPPTAQAPIQTVQPQRESVVLPDSVVQIEGEKVP